uniref:Leucine rich repeat transmembrane neuronal 2 n=1 Tax=Oncorhynchus kisutch TaxID=8019 RepID=A0A8C7MF28_ONCKI
ESRHAAVCLPSPASCTTCPQKCRCEDHSPGSTGHNQITTVQEDAFQGLYKLKDLNLSSNRITTLPNTTFIHLINLQILDLSFTLMTALEPELFHGLRKLQILHLRSNSLLLGLSNNRLRSLARNGFAGLIKLRELHLEHNQLTKINLAHFPRLVALQFLYLQWNKIFNLTCNMEWTWTTLEKMDLTGNEIRVLTPDVSSSIWAVDHFKQYRVCFLLPPPQFIQQQNTFYSLALRNQCD